MYKKKIVRKLVFFRVEKNLPHNFTNVFYIYSKKKGLMQTLLCIRYTLSCVKFSSVDSVLFDMNGFLL